MALHLGPGPVFYYEWLVASRRWQLYATRALFLLIILAAICFVWWVNADSYLHPSRQALARAGEGIFYALVGTQLALVLLAAPAATAGAVCLDKARGALAHLLVTELTGGEIVLGKLAARLLPVLGMLLGALPVLALSILLGGLDPLALAGAFLVTLGVAVAGCALALLLSVWGNKTHEVLLLNYLLWAAFLLFYPVWMILDESVGRSVGRFPPPDGLRYANPFWLAFAPYTSPGREVLAECAYFLLGCVAAAVVFTAVAVVTLRAVAVRQGARRARARRWAGLRLPTLSLPGRFAVSLDGNPVLWREWHRRRPSRWVAAVWLIYGLIMVCLTGLAAVLQVANPSRAHDEFPALVNAFGVVLGLLLISVSSSTSLAEERVRGSLDVLLTTPLTTRAIVWGKWWGAYRAVLFLAVLPALLTTVVALRTGKVVAVPLLVGMVLAYGAALTSLGLGLATWQPRLGRAIAGCVAAYVLGLVAWPVLAFTLASRNGTEGVVMASPFWGIGLMSVWAQAERFPPGMEEIPWWGLLWIVLYLIVAVVLYVATRDTFDRCLGRVPGRREPSPPRRPRPTPSVAGAEQSA